MKQLLYTFLVFSLIFSGCKCGSDKPRTSEKTDNPGQVVVCSYGGSFQDAQRKAFFEQFEKETGIKVIEANWSGEYSKLKAMVEAKNVQWDLVTVAEGSIWKTKTG